MAAVTGQSSRQWMLLGLLGVTVAVYFRYGGLGPGSFMSDELSLPPIDAASLESALARVSTVDPSLLVSEPVESAPDRNLFRYGQRKPPPPDPAELERQRLKAQEELRRREEQARLAKQRQQERAKAAEASKAEGKPARPHRPNEPPAPAKPAPPPITFKLMGILGPPRRKIGVFLNGKSLLLARKGDVVEEKFRILDIGAEWADVGYVEPEHRDVKKRIYF